MIDLRALSLVPEKVGRIGHGCALQYPDPRLKQIAKPVEQFDDEAKSTLLENLSYEVDDNTKQKFIEFIINLEINLKYQRISSLKAVGKITFRR